MRPKLRPQDHMRKSGNDTVDKQQQYLRCDAARACLAYDAQGCSVSSGLAMSAGLLLPCRVLSTSSHTASPYP